MAVGSALLGGAARGVRIRWFSFCFHGFINLPFVSRILFSLLLVFQTFQASWPPSLTHPSCHITRYLSCARSTLGLWLAGDTVPVSMSEEGAQALELGSPDQIHGSETLGKVLCSGITRGLPCPPGMHEGLSDPNSCLPGQCTVYRSISPPMGWCHPHSGWVFFTLLNLSGNAFKATPRGVFPW